MRNRSRSASAALACALCLAAGPASAAGSQALAIGTTIISSGNCRFQTPGPTLLDFGNIDPSSTSNATASVGIPYRCNGGGNVATLTWFVSSDNGLYETGPGLLRMRHTVNPARFLPYALNLPASGTVPKNSTNTLTVNGTILVADFANAIAGVYVDSVVLTMTP